MDIRFLDRSAKIEDRRRQGRQALTVKSGVDSDNAKKIQAAIKPSKMKVQAAIQGDTVRVSGAKRDDLQLAIAAHQEDRAGRAGLVHEPAR